MKNLNFKGLKVMTHTNNLNIFTSTEDNKGEDYENNYSQTD